MFDGLTSRALPLVILSGVCGIGSLVLLLRDANHGARLLSIGAVATVIVGWGVAQWPYLLPETLKVSSRPPRPTGRSQAVLVVFVLAAVIILPSLGLLYVLDQKNLLPGEGVGVDRSRGLNHPMRGCATPAAEARSDTIGSRLRTRREA